MSWYARTGPRRPSSAKFQSQLHRGTQQATGAQYRGWKYSFVAHQTGSGVQRTRYAVSIRDANDHPVAYVRDCASIPQATEAAKRCIDEKLGPPTTRRTDQPLGSIPTLPEFIAARRVAAQEK